MGGVDYLHDVAVPTMSTAAAAAGKPAPRFVCMVPTLLTSHAAAGRELVNSAFRMYGTIPSYRATLERGGAAQPSDVAIVGSEAEVVAGLQAFAAAGATDLVAVIPLAAGAEAAATHAFVSEHASSLI